jgi:hypothetical protein
VNGARPIARAWWLADVLAVIVVSTLINLYMGTKSANSKGEVLELARRALVAGQDDALLLRLYPSLDNLRDWRQKLIAWRYSVFRAGAAR